MITPDLLTPGITAKAWNKPIIITFFKLRSKSIFFLIVCLSAKKRSNPKSKVVHAITSIDLNFSIIPVECKIKPTKIRGIDPNNIKTAKDLFSNMFIKSFLK